MKFVQTAATSRTFDQIVTDYGLISRAKAIREWLLDLSGLIPRIDESPNWCYNASVDGLTLVHYYGGPSLIGTPFGGWSATGGGFLREPYWLEKAQARLGLELLMPEYQNSEGCYGPIHAITKDLDGEPLPRVDWRVLGISSIVGVKTQSVFDAYPADCRALKERLLQKGALDPKQFDVSEGCSPEYAQEHAAMTLNTYLWNTRVKPAIGFYDWQDRKQG